MGLSLQILGRDSHEVGDNLEVLAKELFARLGFGSFIRNAYKTGAEIDLKAKHRVTGTPLLCECKAHNVPLDARAVRLFYSEWEKERKTDLRLFGVFISTSGYTGTARQWYEELDINTKQNFVLIDAETLISQLIDANLTLSAQAIGTILSQRYSIGHLQSYWLTFSAHGLAWVYEYAVDEKPLFFTIVNGNGEAIAAWKCNEILSIFSKDMSQMRLFGIDIRHKVQIELLKEEGSIITTLSQRTQESVTDVQLALDILEEQGIVKNKGANLEYWFVRDIVPFITIAKQFLSNKEATTFLFSKYAQEMILSISFSSYIDNRYRLDMSPQQQEVTARLMAISPSALLSAISQDPSRYIQTRQDIERVFNDCSEKSEWLEFHRTSLLQELVICAAHDLTGREHNLSGYLLDLGIQRYRIKLGIDAIGNKWKTLSVHGEIVAAITKAGEDLSAGNLVSSSDPADEEMLNAMLFLEVGEFERATKGFQRALELCDSIGASLKQYQVVLNNFALVYMRQESWDEAIKHLSKALGTGVPEFPELFTNALQCYLQQKDMNSARQIIVEGERFFPQLIDSEIFKTAKTRLCTTEN